ncbi:unnamed protein product, partial [Laminaria digitata]
HRPLARQRGADTSERAPDTSAVFCNRLSRLTSARTTLVLPKRNSKKDLLFGHFTRASPNHRSPVAPSGTA